MDIEPGLTKVHSEQVQEHTGAFAIAIDRSGASFESRVLFVKCCGDSDARNISLLSWPAKMPVATASHA